MGPEPKGSASVAIAGWGYLSCFRCRRNVAGFHYGCKRSWILRDCEHRCRRRQDNVPCARRFAMVGRLVAVLHCHDHQGCCEVQLTRAVPNLRGSPRQRRTVQVRLRQRHDWRAIACSEKRGFPSFSARRASTGELGALSVQLRPCFDALTALSEGHERPESARFLRLRGHHTRSARRRPIYPR